MFARARILTFRLLDPAVAEEAARMLRGMTGPGVVEGLCLLAERASSAPAVAPGAEAAGVGAVRALSGRDSARAREAIGAALGAASVAIRLEAALALEARPDAGSAPALARCLREDPAPVVRRAALHALARLGPPHAVAIVAALGDPVRRLRRDAIVRVEAPPPRGLGLAPGAAIEGPLREAVSALAPLGAAVRGALELLARRTGVHLGPLHDDAPPPLPRPPWWNDDPAVLLASVRHVEAAAFTGAGLVQLLTFEDSRPYNDHATALRAFAAAALERTATARDLVPVASLLGEPRLPFVRAEVEALLGRLAPERRAAVAERVLDAPDMPAAAIAWAVAERDPTRAPPRPPGGAPPSRGELVRDRILHGDRAAALAEALADADAHVRAAAASALAEVDPASSALATLAVDPDDCVRAAALTPPRAEALRRAPLDEPSVRVIARAAALLGLPLAAFAPASSVDMHPQQDWFGVEPSPSPYLANRPGIDARERVWAARRARRGAAAPPSFLPLSAPNRPLGATGLRLPPLALSGRYGLPEEALDEALERGVRLFFWEPAYEGQTHWLRRLSAARRAGLAFIAGTFEADPRAVRRDAEAALRLLRVEAIDVFVVFWARSPERLGDDVLEALARLVEAGHVKTFGLSTHRRDLAAGAAAQGWPVVMVRHSAAHRGAEAEVFPAARAAGAGVLTFSNLCYGRMLRPAFGEPPSAADCYRYSLAQPGVTTVISGPRDVLQLRENLRVLEAPDLPLERLAALRAFGNRVHRDNREFFELVRWR